MLVWLDAGEDLAHSPLHKIWQSASRASHDPHAFNLLPIVSYKPNMGLIPDRLSESYESDAQQMLPCASRLHINYGASLNPKLMAEDPFYALGEVFELAAASMKQYLNLIEQKLGQFTQVSSDDFDALPNLKYLKRILLRLIQQIRLTRSSITSAQSPKWPSASSERGQRSRSTVERDWSHLEDVAQALDRRCQEAITVLMSTVTIQDAKKAIAQAQRVAKLTFLAFIFVPLSFTTSFFGMNFRELEELSIWRWIVMLVPIMMGTLTVFFVDGRDASPWWKSFVSYIKGE